LEPDKKNLILIVGPTGVGKSRAALDLAEKINGEIINCDSMQVYKGFDIGTDKPPAEDRKKIPHHLLDIIENFAQFTAADFAALASNAITAILRRNRVPLVVGGTGLYFRALVDGLFPGPGRDETVRDRLEEEAREQGLDSLWKRLEAADPAYARKIGPRDRVRIIRALEVFSVTGRPMSEHFSRTQSRLQDFNAIKIGLKLEREELFRRIETRVDRMFERGLVHEVEQLLASGVPVSSPPFRALGYKYVRRYLENRIGLEEAIALTKIDTRHYAKRQMTWFRKMDGVQWFSPGDAPAILAYVEQNLN
jgi:tRNA dimethylallyltransferase